MTIPRVLYKNPTAKRCYRGKSQHAFSREDANKTAAHTDSGSPVHQNRFCCARSNTITRTTTTRINFLPKKFCFSTRTGMKSLDLVLHPRTRQKYHFPTSRVVPLEPPSRHHHVHYTRTKILKPQNPLRSEDKTIPQTNSTTTAPHPSPKRDLMGTSSMNNDIGLSDVVVHGGGPHQVTQGTPASAPSSPQSTIVIGNPGVSLFTSGWHNFSTFSTTAKDSASATFPNTTCLPSNFGHAPSVTKN